MINSKGPDSRSRLVILQRNTREMDGLVQILTRAAVLCATHSPATVK